MLLLGLLGFGWASYAVFNLAGFCWEERRFLSEEALEAGALELAYARISNWRSFSATAYSRDDFLAEAKLRYRGKLAYNGLFASFLGAAFNFVVLEYDIRFREIDILVFTDQCGARLELYVHTEYRG